METNQFNKVMEIKDKYRKKKKKIQNWSMVGLLLGMFTFGGGASGNHTHQVNNPLREDPKVLAYNSTVKRLGFLNYEIKNAQEPPVHSYLPGDVSGELAYLKKEVPKEKRDRLEEQIAKVRDKIDGFEQTSEIAEFKKWRDNPPVKYERLENLGVGLNFLAFSTLYLFPMWLSRKEKEELSSLEEKVNKKTA